MKYLIFFIKFGGKTLTLVSDYLSIFSLAHKFRGRRSSCSGSKGENLVLARCAEFLRD